MSQVGRPNERISQMTFNEKNSQLALQAHNYANFKERNSSQQTLQF
eukprot:CAMPEP_0170508166 /NCGR_PEP_ID=MMETSP0208-20121228/61517_1 /TAXON_ID=197538 /ORGANISM="Strombidium inclinatum, Strain S3" /LENGTH=45 /DNA_ID= /DNA_START= /DNA_END= /DNA_ORIENTATION=